MPKISGRLKFSFAILAIVLFCSIMATYWMGDLTLRCNEVVVQRQRSIHLIQDFLSTLTEAETGQRGFLLTADESYLQPYTAATSQINGDFAELQGLADSGNLARADVDELERLADQKMAELKRSIDLKRRGGNAIELVLAGQGKQTMDAIRKRVAQILDVQEGELKAANITANSYTNFRTIVFLAAAILSLGFLYWAYWRIVDEQNRRDLITTELARQKHLLSVTLASIGDAVIVTDAGGRITFLNEVAENLTGWTNAEALEQQCQNVFRIINEDSRQVVESPVAKVLKLGSIVGLANHTLLIQKDGTEIPIDDSGAPIRESDGTIRGVVLVFRDFTEYKTAETKLLTAKTEAERANQTKDQFLAMLSHELRTPLTPVLATLTSWEAHDQLSEDFRSDVQMIRRNVEMEARLIDDLLDLTRIAKGKISLTLETADVNELLHSVADMYQSEVLAKNIALTMALDAERHFVRADVARLQQVFWNILKNATKFTPSGGSIQIKTADKAQLLTIDFIDSGIGMESQILARLFEPFEQGDGELVRRSGGLGLGMAISKSLMQLHGGQITAASAGPGLGATFSLAIPVVAAPRRLSLAAEPASDAKHFPRRILLVEDHADTAVALKMLLSRLGHSVEIGESVATALKKINAMEFDLLLSDIGLPDGNGIDLIREIRKTHGLPAIALTGFGMTDDIAKCKEAGFDAHLTKPVNFQKLDLLIRQVASAGSSST